MKKSDVTRELANTFAPWSRVRQNEQSVGFGLLNSFAQPMDHMQKELIKQKANYYLLSFNLDEIDLTYTVTLPVSFDFATDNTDPFNPVPTAPTVSGLYDGTWHDVSLAERNTLYEFWYNSYPNRVSLAETVTGIDDVILETTVSGLPITGEWEHHLGGGDIWVTTSGGTTYLELSNSRILRGRVILEGTTRKGTKESESLIFPWDMKQKSKKEWEKLEYIGAFNMEDGVEVKVHSSDFNAAPYISAWNTKYSDNRNKIDEFWQLGTTSGVSLNSTTLDRIEYISDEWQQLVEGFVDKQVVDRWELVDDNGSAISAVDLAIQPFSDNAWVVCSDSMLYCYNTSDYMVSGVDKLRDRTPGTQVAIEVEKPAVVLGEAIQFIPWHVRPIKEILKYHIWYQTPSGTKYSIFNGSPVAWGTDAWVVGNETITRTITNLITITPTEHGEYLLALDVIYIDESEESERVIVPVRSKTPLASISLLSLMSETPVGIDFDADHQLWIKGQTRYYRFNLHKDIMLVDYEQKVIYFKENYSQVKVSS